VIGWSGAPIDANKGDSMRQATGIRDSTRMLSKVFSFNGRIGRKTFAVRGAAAFAVVLLGQMVLSAGLATFLPTSTA
jgi:hypothetical protein